MGRNAEKDAVEIAAKQQRILASAFHIFAERTIERVTMSDVAKEAQVGIATLYRYYSSKTTLVLATATWAWESYLKDSSRLLLSGNDSLTAAQEFDLFLEASLDLYRNHKDLLRFNQFFNIYVSSEHIALDSTDAYIRVIRAFEERFVALCRKGQADGTLHCDMPPQKLFSTNLHLMLAVVTRYAVGLVYADEDALEEELLFQKDLLFKEFTS